jgi:hypothetical protein
MTVSPSSALEVEAQMIISACEYHPDLVRSRPPLSEYVCKYEILLPRDLLEWVMEFHQQNRKPKNSR